MSNEQRTVERFKSARELELEQRVRDSGSLSERLKDSRKRIGNMCAEHRGPRMTIPVEWSDDDFFICLALKDATSKIEDYERLERERDEYKAAHAKAFAQLEGLIVENSALKTDAERVGKILCALLGYVSNYREDITKIRGALAARVKPRQPNADNCECEHYTGDDDSAHEPECPVQSFGEQRAARDET